MPQLELFAEEVEKIEMPYFASPKTDNEKLLNLQYEWLVLGSKKAKDKLWLEALDYAGKCLIIELKKEKKSMPHEVFEDQKMDAVLYLMRRFDQGDGYFIKKNFISAVYAAVIHAHKYKTDSQVIFYNAVKIMNESALTLSLGAALSLARIERDKQREIKTGKKLKRNRKPVDIKQLWLTEVEECIV